MKNYLMLFACIVLVFFSGCANTGSGTGRGEIYRAILPEPEWIRNGEPIEFEGELWYPRSSVDILTDSEVTQLGVYRDIPFYLHKVEIRPFERIYTKFERNKFRVFETKPKNDPGQRAF